MIYNAAVQSRRNESKFMHILRHPGKKKKLSEAMACVLGLTLVIWFHISITNDFLDSDEIQWIGPFSPSALLTSLWPPLRRRNSCWRVGKSTFGFDFSPNSTFDMDEWMKGRRIIRVSCYNWCLCPRENTIHISICQSFVALTVKMIQKKHCNDHFNGLLVHLFLERN